MGQPYALAGSKPLALPPQDPTRPLEVRIIAGVKVRLTNGELVDLKYAWGSLAASGDREMIPAIADKRIMVMALFLNNGAGGAITATVKSGTTAVSALISMAANAERPRPYFGAPYYRGGAVNEAMNVTVSAGADVAFEAFFVEAPVDVDIAS